VIVGAFLVVVHPLELEYRVINSASQGIDNMIIQVFSTRAVSLLGLSSCLSFLGLDPCNKGRCSTIWRLLEKHLHGDLGYTS
jgi:hypothetical protein